MSRGAIQKIIDDICGTLTKVFDDELLSIYLYGSLARGTFNPDHSDINLLVNLKDDVDFRKIRQAMRPIWLKNSGAIKQLPLVSNRSSFGHHLTLNPLLAEHFNKHAQLLTGESSLPNQVPLLPIERESRLASLALQASACLTPKLLSEKEILEVDRKLFRLLRELNIPSIDEETTKQHLFAWVFEDIQKRIETQMEFPSNQFELDHLESPPLINSLVAIYEFDHHLLLVMSETQSSNLSDQILRVNWAEVADRVGEEYRRIVITTPTQLRLLLTYDTPADYYLGNLIHAWGSDPIGDLQTEQWRIYRDLGRLPSTLQLAELPHLYVATSTTDMAMLIHDLQNKLLNIGLRNELLCRLEGLEIMAPATSLPARDTAHELQMEAIYSHLEWWTNHYVTQMQTTLTI